MRESEVLTPPHLHFKLASEQVSSAVARRRRRNRRRLPPPPSLSGGHFSGEARVRLALGSASQPANSRQQRSSHAPPRAATVPRVLRRVQSTRRRPGAGIAPRLRRSLGRLLLSPFQPSVSSFVTWNATALFSPPFCSLRVSPCGSKWLPLDLFSPSPGLQPSQLLNSIGKITPHGLLP